MSGAGRASNRSTRRGPARPDVPRAAWAGFVAEFRRFRTLARASDRGFAARWSDRFPQLFDRTDSTGFDRHYVYHTAWAARVLAQTRPAYHVDVSSSLYFCGIVSAFVPVRFYDYRPADLRLDGLTSQAADLTALPFRGASVPSISCMHVVEHIGLGRYGDPIDPDGDLKAIAELKRVVAPGGSLLFVSPIGKPVVRFNAHRVYAYDQVVEYFAGMELRQFALIPQHASRGGLIEGATREMADAENYACGCFWFVSPLPRV